MSSNELLITSLHGQIDVVIPQEIGIFGIEGMRLARLAADVPDGGVIVEVGSYHGRSAAFMASALPAGSRTRIYCVDHWPNQKHMQIADQGLTKLGLRGSVELIRGESVEVAAAWTKPIDLLFIDAAHKYESVRADFDAWFPHLQTGQVVAFHDYNPSLWPGVVQLVEEIAGRLVKKLGLHKFLWSGRKL